MVVDSSSEETPRKYAEAFDMAAKRRTLTNGTSHPTDLESGNSATVPVNEVRPPPCASDSKFSSSQLLSTRAAAVGTDGGGGSGSGYGGRTGRRRRAIAYAGLFLMMLAMSAVLDMKRAASKAGRARRAKMQLQISSAGVGVGGVGSNVAAERGGQSETDRTGVQESTGGGHGSVKGRAVVGVNFHEGSGSEVNIDRREGQGPNGIKGEVSEVHEEEQKEKRTKITEQELKDDVDQLIAHVDKEREAEQQSGNPQGNTTVSDSQSTNTEGVPGSSESVPAQIGMAPTNGSLLTAKNETVSTIESETVEELFAKSQERIKLWLASPSTKKMIDEHSLRILQALALQATRGDCEQASAELGGSLFKTDAEAASSDDIERTEPLWGAWCIFKGTYKTDAMRDYSRKEKILSSRVEAVLNHSMVDGKAVEGSHSTKVDSSTTNDTGEIAKASNATEPFIVGQLSDFFGESGAAVLKDELAELVPHLDDNELRYLSALGLQATHGDCTKSENREWKETIIGTKTEKQRGALWGAWCVFRGKPRKVAADQFKRRVELLHLEKKKIDRKEASGNVAADEGDKDEKKNSLLSNRNDTLRELVPPHESS